MCPNVKNIHTSSFFQGWYDEWGDFANESETCRYEVVSGTQLKEATEHSDKEIDKFSESE